MRIKKSPMARTNTYETEITGTSVFPATLKGQHVNVLVMFTSDAHGETLSIYDPTTKKQVVVPFEPIEVLIEYTRKNQETK